MNYLVKLKEIRLSKNLTQKDIAEVLDIGTRSYQKYELGAREPSYEKLLKLADYFNVSVDYLLGRTDNPSVNK